MIGWKRIAAVLLFLALGGTATSGATYTGSSANPQGFAAATDFGVHVSLNDPGSPLRGTVTVSAGATETSGGSITTVVIERSPAGANTWTTICTDGGAPWSCSFNTTAVADGEYDLRARATSTSGYTRISATVANRLVDNTAPTATMNDPGAWFSGTISLGATVSDGPGGSGVAEVRYEYRDPLVGIWLPACTGVLIILPCDFLTTLLLNGTSYDFRAIATDEAGNVTTSAAVTNRRVDNASPSGAVTNPGATLRGTVTVSATPADGHSGVASIRIQHSPAGAGTWNDICTDTAAAWSCNWDTTTVTSGLYDLRMIVTDNAGNTFTSATVTNRRVDNVAPAATLTDPGSPLSGTITLNATATDTGGSGVASVRIQYSAAGAGTWFDICTDTGSPYACSANSVGVADGLYDFRAIATDNAGNVTTATVVADRRVDNVAPTAADVQTSDPGGLNGIMEPGDAMTLTYSETMSPASIIAGWDGTGTQAVTVRVNQNTTNDRVLFYNAANTTRLALAGVNGVTLGANHVAANMTWSGTLAYNGASFAITLNSIASGAIIGTATANATLTWTPDAGALDLSGRAASTTPRTELGTADPNF